MARGSKGKVVQVLGTVVDAEFQPDELPTILNSIEVDHDGAKLVLEVAQHIGNRWTRCIAMGATDGLAPSPCPKRLPIRRRRCLLPWP